MKVEDLIKSLQKYNPKADIGISIDGYYESELYLSYICKDTDGKEQTPQTTKQVWIEGIDFCKDCEFLASDYCLAYNCEVNDVNECYQFKEIDNGE